jgi:predicted nucleic acid-binding protein
VVIFIEYYVTFIFREQQTALMAQMQAKQVKEKQANEKVSVVHCTSYVVMPDQHHKGWITMLDCLPNGPSNYSGCMLH